MTSELHPRNGFTLIELSIVMLVIGLLVGGVFVGQSMIRTSQLRSVATEVDRYIKAIDLFQQKYTALPGDMTNATTFWGADSCPSSDYTLRRTVTCNGNGDGKIGSDESANQAEWFRAWQQLSNAAMIEGQYTGNNAYTGQVMSVKLDLNVPRSDLTGAGYTLMYWSVVAGDSDRYATEPGHILAFGAVATNSYTTAPIITAEEAQSIDTKLDDGRPAYGRIKAYKPATLNTQCTTDVDPTVANYKTAVGGRNCALMIQTGF